jgi:hypothetical protein
MSTQEPTPAATVTQIAPGVRQVSVGALSHYPVVVFNLDGTLLRGTTVSLVLAQWLEQTSAFPVCEPYLRLFRRIIPMVGAFDFSPIVAIIVLLLVGNLIASLIHG